MREELRLGVMFTAGAVAWGCLTLSDAESDPASPTGGAAGAGGAAGSTAGSAGAGGTSGDGGSAGGGGAAGSVEAGPAFVRVQHGSADQNAVSSSMAVIETVEPTRSALFFTSRHAAESPASALVRGELSPNSLSFTRSTESGFVGIEWHVVEHSAFSVQRGSVTLSQPSIDVPLASPVDQGRSFALVSHENSGTAFGSNDFVAAELPGPKTLRLRSSAAGPEVSWQVVHILDGSRVERGSTTLALNEGKKVAQLAAAVDTQRSFIVYTYLVKNEPGSVNLRNSAVLGAITSQSEVTFLREVGFLPSGPEIEVSWFVVELASGSVANHAAELAVGDAQRSITLPQAVDPKRSLVLQSWLGAKWHALPVLGSVTFGMQDAMLTYALPQPDVVQVRRSSTQTAVDTNAQVVAF